ncbi:MAG: S-layer homology domain-containing protein, partial [Firmicutes bacterium]|nr:S-layer homology domain-containing protein [Bacillota bacterium]
MANGGVPGGRTERSLPRLAAAAFLAALFAALAVLPPADRASDYAGHWAEEAIAEVDAADIMRGYPDGRFAPNAYVTKLEVVALLLRASGLEQQAAALE